jgi:hypothetical protein
VLLITPVVRSATDGTFESDRSDFDFLISDLPSAEEIIGEALNRLHKTEPAPS